MFLKFSVIVLEKIVNFRSLVNENAESKAVYYTIIIKTGRDVENKGEIIENTSRRRVFSNSGKTGFSNQSERA